MLCLTCHQKSTGTEIDEKGFVVNENMRFRKAVKHGAKLRFAVCGPSGSGKTYTLLTLATELGGPIAILDTEHGSASKYADIFEFDVLELDSYDPLRLIELIDDAVEHRYRVLCIDSLSHFWIGKDGELEKVDRAARRMQTPNSFAAWKQVTPIHNALIDKIISAPLHIMVSMRSKTEWILDRDDRTGKTVPRKVGLAPVMRDGIEYEFDVCGEMDQENTLQVTKSRCPKLSGGVFPKPGREVADVLKEWLGSDAVSDQERQPPRDAPVTPVEPNKGGRLVDGVVGLQSASAIPEELASIWKRICTPRGVVKEFVGLEAEMERLAGSAGVAEYYRILRKHGVDHPKRFKASQPSRLCAKEVFGLMAELRRNARENDSQVLSGQTDGASEAPGIALEVS
jgi:AAA domain